MKLSEIKSEARICAFPVTTMTEQHGWLNCPSIRSLFVLYSYLRSSQKAETRIHSLLLTSKLLLGRGLNRCPLSDGTSRSQTDRYRRLFRNSPRALNRLVGTLRLSLEIVVPAALGRDGNAVATVRLVDQPRLIQPARIKINKCSGWRRLRMLCAKRQHPGSAGCLSTVENRGRFSHLRLG